MKKMINSSGSPILGIGVLLVVWIVPLCGWASFGQFAARIDLVEVYTTVTDTSGEPLTGLTRDDFIVTDNDAPQTIEAFAAGEFPLSLAVALDRSFSISTERLSAVGSAVRGFIGELRPTDQVMVLAIGSETEVLAPLSTEHAKTIAALKGLEPWGTTPLHDAVLQALDEIQPASGRRALVLLSDGIDRYSTATEADAVATARRRDVLIYPIALGRTRPPIFAELAAVTGGRSFQSTDQKALERSLSSIAKELRAQYLLGYSPPRPAGEAAAWHSIGVRVRRPGVNVRARDGYFSR
jgi:Ca-activated chloride channel family protein